NDPPTAEVLLNRLEHIQCMKVQSSSEQNYMIALDSAEGKALEESAPHASLRQVLQDHLQKVAQLISQYHKYRIADDIFKHPAVVPYGNNKVCIEWSFDPVLGGYVAIKRDGVAPEAIIQFFEQSGSELDRFKILYDLREAASVEEVLPFDPIQSFIESARVIGCEVKIEIESLLFPHANFGEWSVLPPSVRKGVDYEEHVCRCLSGFGELALKGREDEFGAFLEFSPAFHPRVRVFDLTNATQPILIFHGESAWSHLDLKSRVTQLFSKLFLQRSAEGRTVELACNLIPAEIGGFELTFLSGVDVIPGATASVRVAPGEERPVVLQDVYVQRGGKIILRPDEHYPRTTFSTPSRVECLQCEHGGEVAVEDLFVVFERCSILGEVTGTAGALALSRFSETEVGRNGKLQSLLGIEMARENRTTTSRFHRCTPRPHGILGGMSIHPV
ncbi:MAG: hypothetical protein KDD60_06955, partial [Bdellovibrionales bacterium]|nr:hypothetical protein [Bdellovibrionales bacterium]